MTEKRYFKKEWEEEYYIFDSTHISEEKVNEESEYDYNVFARAMQGDEVVDKLNKQECNIKELQQLVEDMSDYIEKLGGWED